MAQAPITLESHGISVPLGQSPELDRFAASVNAKVRIKGLDDARNPGIIDAAKLRAMVAAIPAQPEPVRGALAGLALLMSAPGFGVLAVEPARADSFGSNYRIAFERSTGHFAIARANPLMDAALGRAGTLAGKAATRAADQAVRSIEAGRPDPDGLEPGAARWRRAQAARGWAITARGWLEAAPGDPAAAEAAEEARTEAAAFSMPSGDSN